MQISHSTWSETVKFKILRLIQMDFNYITNFDLFHWIRYSFLVRTIILLLFFFLSIPFCSFVFFCFIQVSLPPKTKKKNSVFYSWIYIYIQFIVIHFKLLGVVYNWTMFSTSCEWFVCCFSLKFVFFLNMYKNDTLALVIWNRNTTLNICF